MEIAGGTANGTCCCTAAHLSGAELRVVQQLAEGKTTEQAATFLGVAPSTVANQVARMFDKLGSSNRVQLIALCFASDVLRTGCWPPQLTGRRCLEPVMRQGPRAASPGDAGRPSRPLAVGGRVG